MQCHIDHPSQGCTVLSLLFTFITLSFFQSLSHFLAFSLSFYIFAPSTVFSILLCLAHYLSFTRSPSPFCSSMYVSFFTFFLSPLSLHLLFPPSLFHFLKQIDIMSKWWCNFTVCPKAGSYRHRHTYTVEVCVRFCHFCTVWLTGLKCTYTLHYYIQVYTVLKVHA